MKVRSKKAPIKWPKFNTHLNRYESVTDHTYAKFDYSDCPYNDSLPIEARIKCRLVHMDGNSIVVPDFILLNDGGWIQPLFFNAPRLAQFSEKPHSCDLYIDIQNGKTIKIRFYSNGLLKEFADKSHLYKCELYGPSDIQKYSSGTYFEENGQILLHLFHHTNDAGFDGINKSLSLWASRWNYRGSKECINYNFVYFTHIPEITYDSDLITVAMSVDGKLDYIVDSFNGPAPSSPNFREDYKEFIYTAEVYRSTSADRNCPIDFDISIEAIDIKHLYLHHQGYSYFYEVCFPYIHRLKTLPEAVVSFNKEFIIESNPAIVNSDYAIVGDARSKEGLAAPFDEEDTSFIFKIEDCQGRTIHDYWFNHSNQDLFTLKKVKELKVEAVTENPTNK